MRASVLKTTFNFEFTSGTMTMPGLIPKESVCRKPLWMDFAAGFSDDCECLAAFIAFEAAGVLDGIKPSTLLNFVDRRRRYGRNFYELWRKHGLSLMRESSLEVKVMAERHGSLLLLIYDRGALGRLLSNRSALAMLRTAGYREPFQVDDLLSAFASRFESGGVPHEIGILLGYPLKDVAGFMGIGRQRFTCQGPWRIYGNPRESLMLAESYLQCRCRMARRLMAGCGPCQCLGRPGFNGEFRRDGVFLPIN